jgi:hypothetical protein
MVALVKENPALQVNIFSGALPGNLNKALIDPHTQVGTLIAHQAVP